MTMSASCGTPALARSARLDHQWQLDQRYHGNLNIRREGVDAARLIADLRDIAFSLGIGLRQRIGPAEPRAASARAERREARSSHPARVRPLYD